jgi:hypothetical protein
MYYTLVNGLKKNLNANEIILIHQMGKVGSQSVLFSLLNSSLTQPVLQTHILEPEYFQTKRQKINAADYNSAVNSHEVISYHIWQLLNQGLPFNRKWKVVTLMRDPVARNISMFFQASGCPGMISDNYIKRAADQDNVDGLIKKFLLEYGHKQYALWFDAHLNKPFGIDIFKYEFPKSKGYQILKFSHNVELLIIKLEKLNECYEQAFSEFLGIENLSLIKHNIASQKSYAKIYKEFLQKARFPRDFLAEVYDSQTVRHFYTEEEVEGFIHKWLAQEPSIPSTTIANYASERWWG